MRTFFAIFAFALFFVCGVYVSVNNQQYYENEYAEVSVSRRDPAAIKKVYDFSNLEGSALSDASKQRLLSGIRVIHEQQDIGLELGHFVVRGEDGQKTFACQKYTKLIMTFQSEGVAVAGQPSTMEVEGHCEISAHDINSISPLWIPVAKVLGEPVSDGEFDFREGHQVRLRFANVSDEWPHTWVLTNVKMVDEQTQQEMGLDLNEIKKFSNNPVVIQW